MAKSIRPTPILNVKQGREFLKKLKEEEKHPDPKRLEMLKKVKEMDFEVIT